MLLLVSIIIITLNEVENLELTLKSSKNAALMSSGKKLPIEIIVSDGGSKDGFGFSVCIQLPT